MPDGARNGDHLAAPAVEERLARLDELLGRLEQLTGPIGELALDTVGALTEVYGAALARVMARLSSMPDVAAALAADELLGHLFALHGIHPLPVRERVERAIEDVRPALQSHGGEVELVAVEGDVVRVRLSGSCNGCASSSTTLERLLSDAILGIAPEIARVESVPQETAPQPQTAFVPLADLRKPVPR